MITYYASRYVGGKILKKIGFEWPVINFEYIKKLLDYLKKIKFIENRRDNG